MMRIRVLACLAVLASAASVAAQGVQIQRGKIVSVEPDKPRVVIKSGGKPIAL